MGQLVKLAVLIKKVRDARYIRTILNLYDVGSGLPDRNINLFLLNEEATETEHIIWDATTGEVRSYRKPL